MVQFKSMRMREINPKDYGEDMKFTPSEEAKICLNCDLPECKNRGPCKRFREEKRKLKGKLKGKS